MDTGATEDAASRRPARPDGTAPVSPSPPIRLGLLLLLALAGCGGGGGDAAPPPGPAIERATAEQLASTSDAIADALDGGDVCGAAGLADELNDQVIAAINAGQIPAAFMEDLLARANELVNTVNCPSTSDEEDGGDDEEKKDKKKKGKEGDEELVPPEPLPTVTEGEE